MDDRTYDVRQGARTAPAHSHFVRRTLPTCPHECRALRSTPSASCYVRSAHPSRALLGRVCASMSGRATRAASARAHADDDRSTLLSLPLRVAALSWGLGTLPLTATLVLVSKLTGLFDALLALVGLTRRGRAAALAMVNENALRAQLRSTCARLKARSWLRRVRVCPARRGRADAAARADDERATGTQ